MDERNNEPTFNVPGQWRTARKSHVCRACEKGIGVGERYFEYTGEVPAFQTGYPYHRTCAIETWSKF